MKIHFDFLALRDLVVCMKQKYIFYEKPGILIPDLYLLQYKNTNQYHTKFSRKISGKSYIFLNDFFLEIFFTGLDPTQKEIGPRSAPK
jgi:hypothetical protein